MEEIGRDYLDNPVQVGDKVVTMKVGYRNLVTREVKKITPKMFMFADFKQFQDQVVKIIKPKAC